MFLHEAAPQVRSMLGGLSHIWPDQVMEGLFVFATPLTAWLIAPRLNLRRDRWRVVGYLRPTQYYVRKHRQLLSHTKMPDA